MRLILLSFIALCFCISVTAQERNISGKITAFNTYELSGVKITARKAKTEVLTNEQGNFQIKCKKNDALKIQADGFQTQVIKLSDDNVLKINLIYLNSGPAFKSAVEAKHITENDLEYAVENLMQENNDYSRYQNIFELIQAISPLAKVVNSDGFNRIYLTSQGPNTLAAGAHALLVLDGMITENISSVQPVQVASIKVITGADASMYGTRGGNGVIEIELKH
ncbi:carboxypeptidase-like regulatory domain-containing protein [uncultured Draconibacterium sp.]|uniref:carboxypeptidase-like regulatory domain-containing protein n=1 Tax=uncultured Draconibacterium sp. TaxID=1573823 RepID=UPI003261BCA7